MDIIIQAALQIVFSLKWVITFAQLVSNNRKSKR